MAYGLENYIANEYLRALIVILVVFLVLRFVVFVVEKIFLKAAAKTETDADDIFVKKSSKPLSLMILLFGLRIAIGELSLDVGIEGVVVNIIWSLVAVFVTYIILLVVDLFLFRGLKKAAKTHYEAMRDLFSLVKSASNLVLYVLAFLYILSIWGVEIGPFLAGLGIAGIAIAFALQSTLNNVFGGISIILDKSVKAGDVVNLEGNVSGRVMQIGLRSTKIQTWDNELMIVPNGKLADSTIHNIALPEPKTRVKAPFSVAYGTDIDKVKKLILAEVKKVKNFEKDPGPSVRFKEMADSCLKFTAYFYVNSYTIRASALDEANTRIYNALVKAGIEIPFPQMDIHMKKEK